MAKVIHSGKSHGVWVLPYNGISHSSMAKPMDAMKCNIHGFCHSPLINAHLCLAFFYTNLHRNTPSLLFWSLILSLLLHPLCACLQMGYFLLSCCKQCASGLQLCQVNWHLKSLLQSAQGLTLVFASIPLIWSKLRQQNQSPPCRFACKNTCLVCNIITSNILNILNTHNFPKKNLNLSTAMSFSQALVSLFVLLCSGPGLDSISPQRSKWQGKECWLSTDDLALVKLNWLVVWTRISVYSRPGHENHAQHSKRGHLYPAEQQNSDQEQSCTHLK